MKLFIASDLHGSAYYCKKMIDALEVECADRLILLGDLLYHGPRNDLPKEERKRFFMKAIENENKLAEYNYAIELLNSGNVDEAKEYLEKSGLHGHAEAYMKLAELVVPEAGEHYYNYSKIDVTLLPQKYHQQEFDYYKKASELGNLKAMVYVGIAYKQGYVVSRDYDVAYNYFAKAVELGDEFYASYYFTL